MSESGNDGSFSADEKRVLASVLDEIIPPSADGRLPGAGQIGVGQYLDEALAKTLDLRSMIVEGLSELDQQARSRKGMDFAALSRPDKLELLNEQAFILPLTLHVYIGYYQHPRVAEALGLEPRAPHPKGYEMQPNDLSLLDAVRRRPKLYRES